MDKSNKRDGLDSALIGLIYTAAVLVVSAAAGVYMFCVLVVTECVMFT